MESRGGSAPSFTLDGKEPQQWGFPRTPRAGGSQSWGQRGGAQWLEVGALAPESCLGWPGGQGQGCPSTRPHETRAGLRAPVRKIQVMGGNEPPGPQGLEPGQSRAWQ